MPWRAVAAVILVASVAVSACSAGGGADRAGGRRGEVTLSAQGAEAPTDPGLAATLQRSTLFETRRALRLSIRNAGADDLVVETIQLSSPLFEPVAADQRDTRLDAGGRPVVVPVPFGAARCGDDVPEDVPAAEAIAVVGGEERRVAVEQRPSSVLAELQSAECAVTAVRADVDVRLGEAWTVAAPRTIRGDIEVSLRRPGVTAVVDEVLGNVIFAVGAGADVPTGEPWLTVDDDRPSGRIPVTIEAARCDPHALTEYKRTFIFVALVAIDGVPPVRVDVEAEGASHRALEDLLTSCLG
jgi:hypothetical protein